MRILPAAALALLMGPALALAQPVEIVIPANLVLPNYARISVGQREGLEAGAFIARTDNSLANWYNPAGLVLSPGTQLNASATAYEGVQLDFEGLGEATTSTRLATIGSFFGGVIGKPLVKGDRHRLGFSITTPTLWRPGTLTGGVRSEEPGNLTDLSLASEVELRQMQPGLAAGWAVAGGVRLGAGLALAMTSLTQRQEIELREIEDTSAVTLRRSATSSGTAYDVVLSAGAQWDVSPGATLGARARSPGLRVTGSSRLSYGLGVYGGGGMEDVFFHDPSARFDYRIPFEIGVGAGLRMGRGEVEVDLTYHGSTGEYSLFESDLTGVSTVAVPGGTAVTYPSLAAVRNEWRGVANLAVGGNYRVSERARAHAGFATDRSPVADATASPFQKVNLYNWSAGVSWQGKSLSGSLGVGYSHGRSAPRPVSPELGDTGTETRMVVKSLGLAYALSFSF